MTLQLCVDPGRNSGVAIGYYSDAVAWRLEERWQVHGGVEGFLDWLDARTWPVNEIVCEKFVLDQGNQFAADLTPVQIEGLVIELGRRLGVPVHWQPRTDKARLTGYPESATTKAQRQRVRFDFLGKHALFMPGTDNDDSNDAITHGLVRMKAIRHLPTLRKYWR